MRSFFSDVITLRSFAAVATDDDGYITARTPTDTEVFADMRSVGRAEFYQALQANVKAAIVFRVRAADYAGQTRVVYNGAEYDVIRSYRTDVDYIDLTCSRVGCEWA